MPRIREYFTKIHLFIKTHKKFLLIPLIIIPFLIYFLYPKNKNTVETTKVTRGELTQSISTNGSMQSENSVKLSFLVGGKLTYLKGKQGDLIAKGNTLATLDQRSIKKNIDNALLDYSKQRNTYDQTLKNNNASNINDAVNDTIKRTLQNNQYDLNKSVNSLELQELARDQAVLVSPISGIITRMDVDNVGVNVKVTDVFEVTDPNSMSFTMEVDEADIGKIQLGQEVKVVLDSYPDETLNLSIDYIDFSTHKTTTGGDAYYVKGNVLSDNSTYKYKVGMNGSAEVVLDKKYDVITIPLSSVFEDNKVYVKNGKKYEKREVTLGAQNDTDTEITNGLKEGEEVVLDPSLVK